MDLLLPLLLLLQSGLLLVRADVHEYRLLKDLMRDYDSSSRPVKNSTTALRVVFGMSLHLIIDVDERNQILTTNCWLTQMWNDSHLTWNASDYGGIHVIRIPYQRVWRPDIILYNNADAQYSSSVINTNVIVSDNGEVVWLSHGIFRSSCDINVEYFPFDLQKCKMKWASWTYDGYQIDLQKQTNEGDMSNYQTNGEFDLINFEAIHSVQFYSCCPEPYPDITFVITMKRRPLFYVFNLILPCLLINGIALLVFYVPSESGEKVTLGISALLSMTVFLMTIRESLPPTEKTPLISLYYGVSICLVSFASGLSVVTLNLHHRGLRGTAVPYYLRRIVLDCLARVVFLRFEADPTADLHHQQQRSTQTNRDNGNKAITRQVESSATSTSTTVTTRSDSSTKSLRRDPRCTCSHPSTESISRKRRKPAISVTQSSLSAWYTPSINGLPSSSNGRRLRDVERLTSGYVEPDFSDKFQAQDMDYLGIGPPSPIFCTRRIAGIPKPPPPPPRTPPSPPPPPPQPFASEIVGSADVERPVMEGSNVRRVISRYEEQLALVMARVTTAVECNELRVQDQERREAIALEWKQLALVCDRILLLTFVIVTTVATCVVLTSSPHGP